MIPVGLTIEVPALLSIFQVIGVSQSQCHGRKAYPSSYEMIPVRAVLGTLPVN